MTWQGSRHPQVTPPDLTIDYRRGDYRDQTGPFEFMISSQVAHHMTDKGWPWADTITTGYARLTALSPHPLNSTSYLDEQDPEHRPKI